ncbi:MAG: hypothetical protein O3B24_10245 [Verrucomicrobia bacterium]|nr:hypothetical protein [Verrucomicrobiota bacterium]
MWWPKWLQEIVIGGIIIAVVLARWRHRRMAQRVADCRLQIAKACGILSGSIVGLRDFGHR